MPKDNKNSTPNKCPKVWEKARRDKLKGFFDELSRLLPDFDPATPPPRAEIIQKAMGLIRYLQAQNEDLLSGGFDEVYRSKLEKWKQRVKDLVCRVEQLSEILRTANIHIPPLALEAAPLWTKIRPKHWTKKVCIPQDKIQLVVEQINHTNKRKKQNTVNGKRKIATKKKGKVVVQSKENQPADKILVVLEKVPVGNQSGKKSSLLDPKKSVGSSLNSFQSQNKQPIVALSNVAIPEIQAFPNISKIISVPSDQTPLIQQPTPILQGNLVAQPNTYILTNQGSLLPVLAPTSNVLTPVIINRPAPLFVVQQPVIAHHINPLTPIVAKPPPNKRRIERDSTVMTYTNKLPIPALSKHSHPRRGGKCAAHKTGKSNSLLPLLSSSSPSVSPTTDFLNAFPVVSSAKIAESGGQTQENVSTVIINCKDAVVTEPLLKLFSSSQTTANTETIVVVESEISSSDTKTFTVLTAPNVAAVLPTTTCVPSGLVSTVTNIGSSIPHTVNATTAAATTTTTTTTATPFPKISVSTTLFSTISTPLPAVSATCSLITTSKVTPNSGDKLSMAKSSAHCTVSTSHEVISPTISSSTTLTPSQITKPPFSSNAQSGANQPVITISKKTPENPPKTVKEEAVLSISSDIRKPITPLLVEPKNTLTLTTSSEIPVASPLTPFSSISHGKVTETKPKFVQPILSQPAPCDPQFSVTNTTPAVVPVSYSHIGLPTVSILRPAEAFNAKTAEKKPSVVHNKYTKTAPPQRQICSSNETVPSNAITSSFPATSSSTQTLFPTDNILTKNLAPNPFASSWTPSSASNAGVSWSPITTSSNIGATQLPPLVETTWLPLNESATPVAPVDWRPMPSEALWPSVPIVADPWNISSKKTNQQNIDLKAKSSLQTKTSEIKSDVQGTYTYSTFDEKQVPLKTSQPPSSTYHTLTTPSIFSSNNSSVHPSSFKQSKSGVSSFETLRFSQKSLESHPPTNMGVVHTSSHANLTPLSSLSYFQSPITSNSSNYLSYNSPNNIAPKHSAKPTVLEAASTSATLVSKSVTTHSYSSSTSKPSEPFFNNSTNYPIPDSSIYNPMGDHGYSTSLLKTTLPESSYIPNFVNFTSESSFHPQTSYSLSVSRTLLQNEPTYSLTSSKTPMAEVNYFPASSLDTIYPSSSSLINLHKDSDSGKGHSIGSFTADDGRRPHASKPNARQYSTNAQTFPMKQEASTRPQKSLRTSTQKESSNPKHPTSTSSKIPSNDSNTLWNSSYLPQVQPVGINPDSGPPWGQLEYSYAIESKETRPKPPINWMTEPEPRADTMCPTDDPFQNKFHNFLERKDSLSSQNMFEYCLTNLSEEDSAKSKGKKKEGDAGQDYFSWLSMKVDPLVVPCTLPTLVGDLALGSEPTPTKRPKLAESYPISRPKNSDNHAPSQEPFTNLSKNIFDCTQGNSTKGNSTNETIVLKNIFELPTPSKRKINQGQNSFLSVSQLVEPHTIEEIGSKSDCTYYTPSRGKGKAMSGWKCSEKKCPKKTFTCGGYSAEALLRSSAGITQQPISQQPDYNLSNPAIFPQEFNQDSSIIDNQLTKPKTYAKQRKQESWKEFQQLPSSSYPSVLPSPAAPQNFAPEKVSITSKTTEAPFTLSYLPDSRLGSHPTPNITIHPPSSTPLPYPKFPENAPLLPGRGFTQQKPGETMPFAGVFPPPRPATDTSLIPPGSRYPGPRKPFAYSRPNKTFPQFSPSFSYDGNKKAKSSGPAMVQPCNVFPVGGPYPPFPALPPQPVGPSGSSLANFNLTTIFPEMNKKGSYQYP